MSNEEALQILSERDRIRVNIINANDAETVRYNNDSVEALSMGIKAIKCIADIKEYLTDTTVTWRDVSDDCITEIMEKYGFMDKEEEEESE